VTFAWAQHSPKDADKYRSTWSEHLLHRLHHSGLLCHGLYMLRKSFPCSNGLWPLCGYLSSLEAHCHHEPASYHAGPGLFLRITEALLHSLMYCSCHSTQT
jgi:hypothetical protein